MLLPVNGGSKIVSKITYSKIEKFILKKAGFEKMVETEF